MKLTLTDREGILINTWDIPETDAETDDDSLTSLEEIEQVRSSQEGCATAT